MDGKGCETECVATSSNMKSLSKLVFTTFLVLLVKDGKIQYKDGVAGDHNTECELSEQSPENFLWASPGLGISNYVTDFNCTYHSTITGPRIATYTLTTFQIQEKARDKCRDKVRIYKPYNRNVKLCGYHSGRVISIPMGATYSEFVSNHRKGDYGFSISVSYSTNNTGVVPMSSSGTTSYTLLSPHYPMKVSDLVGEYWFEATEEGKRIKVDVDIDSKKTRCCRRDYLVVSPIGNSLYPRSSSRIFCGIKKTSVLSKNQKMYVSFRSHHRVKFNLTLSLI